MSAPRSRSSRFGWLVTDFADRVPAVRHAVVVSADGIPVTGSARLPPESADQLAAVAAGLTGLAQGAARCFENGGVIQTVVEMCRGTLLCKPIGDGSVLAVLATPSCDIGLISYEMTLLIERVGQRLSPPLTASLARR